MPLLVLSFAKYLTRGAEGWRQSDYNAYKFVRAIKGRTINGYAWIPIRPGRQVRLIDANRESAVGWFGEMAAPHVLAALRGVARPIAFVPIPNHDCTADAAPPRTLLLAEDFAHRCDGVALDVLRWREPQVPSSRNGTRDPALLYRSLLSTRAGVTGSCVLVDDVSTSGGHFQAAAAALRSVGGRPVLGVCAGRTVHEPAGDPFAVHEEILEDYPQRSGVT